MVTLQSILAAGAALTLLSLPALAQAPQPQPQSQPQPQPQPQPQSQQPVTTWEGMRHMQLEAEYAGPLKDTTIQRWRDPALNVACYLYLPFTAQHSTPTATGYVQYGANNIGSISCVPVVQLPAVAAKSAPTEGKPKRQ
jgi:hypothetical protein